MPQLTKDYIDTGKVYFEVYDYPLMQIHPGALMAAQAANCAAERGQYLLMRRQIYAGAANKEWREGSLDDLVTFSNYAVSIGLERGSFESCVTTNRHLAQIKADIARAEQIGVNSTPAFVISGRLILGAQPYTEFARIIDVLISPP